jgi:SSS family solute:Na+ symporter
VLVKRKFSPRGRLMFAKGLSVFTLLLALVCGIVSQSLSDVYYISSGVLSACIAVPAVFIFWRRTTLPGVLVAAVAGFVGTLAAFIVEYHYPSLLPAFLQPSQGYNYVAAGVILSLISIVTVSLITAPSKAEQLAAIELAPVENYNQFVAQTSQEPSLPG